MLAKMTDMKFIIVGDGHSDFTSDKTDMPASFRKDCFKNKLPV